MKRILFWAFIFFTMLHVNQSFAQSNADNFYKSSSVRIEKVSFQNQYKMAIVGNLMHPTYIPEGAKLPAIIVGHPMGAVKEQSANLYATKMAERGFITLSIDLPFWGESEGEPRNKAITTISMYDMGAASRNALRKSQTLEQRKAIVQQAAQQRYAEFAGGKTEYTGGTAYSIDENSHPIVKEFYDFYRTSRGEFTPQGATTLSTTRPTLTSNVKFMNFYPFNDLDMISPRALLFVTGDEAHSKEFSEDAYQKASEPKELYYVKGAGHVDLYDRTDLIPFDKLKDFFTEHLK